MTKHAKLMIAVGVAALAASAAVAGSPDWENPPARDRASFTPYLSGEGLEFHVLGGPPAADSQLEKDDIVGIARRQKEVSVERRRQAELDGDWLYPRFEAAFGLKIDRQTLPFTVRLLNRMERTVSKPVFAAKDVHPRARPYQVMKLGYVCGGGTDPKVDHDVAKQTSYPSGHSAYGWTAAVVLAELSPERAGPLLARGMDYGESRLVCGVHFPSDVAAARTIASAVFERSRATADFQRDLACAKAEVKAARGGAADPVLQECKARFAASLSGAG